MSYSRRQLEALGETLGECVTRKEGGRVIYGGGGGGGGSAPAPAPAATACLAIGGDILEMAEEHFGWKK